MFIYKYLFFFKKNNFFFNQNFFLFPNNDFLVFLVFLKNRFIWLDTSGFFLKKLLVFISIRDFFKKNQINFVFTPLLTKVFSNWMFREFNEFFKKVFFLKNDNRNLLLNYSTSQKPLVKSFPKSGFTEVIFSFEQSSLISINTNFIEL
jgi:hypothetical protein